MGWFEDLMVEVCLVGIAVGFLASWLNARAERKMWEEFERERELNSNPAKVFKPIYSKPCAHEWLQGPGGIRICRKCLRRELVPNPAPDWEGGSGFK